MLRRRDRLMLVRTTVGKETDAVAMARRLLAAGAACVHVAAVRSFYVWKGKAEDEGEWMVEARTTQQGEQAARDAMAQGHPYELPVIESWPVSANPEYAAWAASASR